MQFNTLRDVLNLDADLAIVSSARFTTESITSNDGSFVIWDTYIWHILEAVFHSILSKAINHHKLSKHIMCDRLFALFSNRLGMAYPELALTLAYMHSFAKLNPLLNAVMNQTLGRDEIGDFCSCQVIAISHEVAHVIMRKHTDLYESYKSGLQNSLQYINDYVKTNQEVTRIVGAFIRDPDENVLLELSCDILAIELSRPLIESIQMKVPLRENTDETIIRKLSEVTSLYFHLIDCLDIIEFYTRRLISVGSDLKKNPSINNDDLFRARYYDIEKGDKDRIRSGIAILVVYVHIVINDEELIELSLINKYSKLFEEYQEVVWSEFHSSLDWSFFRNIYDDILSKNMAKDEIDILRRSLLRFHYMQSEEAL